MRWQLRDGYPTAINLESSVHLSIHYRGNVPPAVAAALGASVMLSLAMFDAAQSQSAGTLMYRQTHATLTCCMVLMASAVVLGSQVFD